MFDEEQRDEAFHWQVGYFSQVPIPDVFVRILEAFINMCLNTFLNIVSIGMTIIKIFKGDFTEFELKVLRLRHLSVLIVF